LTNVYAPETHEHKPTLEIAIAFSKDAGNDKAFSLGNGDRY
jgi:hypothetical protein